MVDKMVGVKESAESCASQNRLFKALQAFVLEGFPFLAALSRHKGHAASLSQSERKKPVYRHLASAVALFDFGNNTGIGSVVLMTGSKALVTSLRRTRLGRVDDGRRRADQAG
jgi:hypothetical protein